MRNWMKISLDNEGIAESRKAIWLNFRRAISNRINVQTNLEQIGTSDTQQKIDIVITSTRSVQYTVYSNESKVIISPRTNSFVKKIAE